MDSYARREQMAVHDKIKPWVKWTRLSDLGCFYQWQHFVPSRLSKILIFLRHHSKEPRKYKELADLYTCDCWSALPNPVLRDAWSLLLKQTTSATVTHEQAAFLEKAKHLNRWKIAFKIDVHLLLALIWSQQAQGLIREAWLYQSR